MLQLFLHFSVGSVPSAGMEMDIIVEKSCSVKEVRDCQSCKIFKYAAVACMFSFNEFFYFSV